VPAIHDYRLATNSPKSSEAWSDGASCMDLADEAFVAKNGGFAITNIMTLARF
jgi:hypothetical protein